MYPVRLMEKKVFEEVRLIFQLGGMGFVNKYNIGGENENREDYFENCR
jgi:hypothetical protein